MQWPVINNHMRIPKKPENLLLWFSYSFIHFAGIIVLLLQSYIIILYTFKALEKIYIILLSSIHNALIWFG